MSEIYIIIWEYKHYWLLFEVTISLHPSSFFEELKFVHKEALIGLEMPSGIMFTSKIDIKEAYFLDAK
jgi:hypothetical protein